MQIFVTFVSDNYVLILDFFLFSRNENVQLFSNKIKTSLFFQWRKWANLIFFTEKCDIKFGEIVFTAKVVLLFILSTANHFLALESLETIVWTSTHAFWEVNFLCSQWLFRCRKRYNRTCFIKPHFYAFLHLNLILPKAAGVNFCDFS